MATLWLCYVGGSNNNGHMTTVAKEATVKTLLMQYKEAVMVILKEVTIGFKYSDIPDEEIYGVSYLDIILEELWLHHGGYKEF